MPAPDTSAAFLRAFGRAVRVQRTVLGLSQEDLCFRSKLDRTYISGVERGVRNPTLRSMLRLAGALEVKVDKLLAAAQTAVDAKK